jgi:pSer/pThr/pTyr-binding forkhead associated (FHA) protein
VAPATPRSKTVFGSAQPSANPEAVPPARARTGGAEYEVKAPQAAAAAVEALPAYVQGKKTERRIIGVLLTYTWRPEGQIFPICEGRNRIGRSDECEIQLPEDSHLSGLNTHITYRKNFKIGDLVSMGGTDLNGEPVEDTNVHLPNYAQIRAGSTHFTFIAADPAFAAA